VASGLSRKAIDGGSLVMMKAIALALVLCLTGPAVAAAVCDWRCVRAHHHAANAAPGGCHEHQPKSGTTLMAVAAQAICHREAEIPSALVSANLNKARAMSAVVQALPSISFEISRRPARVALIDIRPPDPPPTTATPLRI
jgi:hypothetical protein